MPRLFDPSRARSALGPLQLLRLGRGQPVSPSWGWDRGLPIDRHYIESFLAANRGDIRGRVLEVKGPEYAHRFGENVERVDVLDIDITNTSATIVADLANGDGIPQETFDCFILTQTLQYVYDVRAAVSQAAALLVPGGVLLATVPGISRVSSVRPGVSPDDFWRFTPAACRELATREFGDSHAHLVTYGNALSAAAFIAGLATEELTPSRVAAHDERFPVLIAFRAVKP
ncbi:MAG: methyltransferase domain-containing protein [Actinobacteria bacterium]|nr:methyltransferase domain-containing protein [Actinomycetota bacterium]